MRILKLIFSITFIILTFVLSGCKDDIVSEDDLQPPPGTTATFNQIQKQVFNTSCALSGCHAGSNPQAGLSLVEGQSYSKLINVQSVLYPSQKRVIPGNKEASLLYNVLSYNSETKMPPPGKLNQSLIDSVGAWIDRGALNN